MVITRSRTATNVTKLNEKTPVKRRVSSRTKKPPPSSAKQPKSIKLIKPTKTRKTTKSTKSTKSTKTTTPAKSLKTTKTDKPVKVKAIKTLKTTTQKQAKTNKVTKPKKHKALKREKNVKKVQDEEDTIGKDLTPYRRGQLKKKLKMIQIANSVKPCFWGKPTNKLHSDQTQTHGSLAALKIALDPQSKYGINTTTAYNPLRTEILEAKTSKELLELKQKVDRPKILNQLKLPSVRSDELLKAALNELKQEVVSQDEKQLTIKNKFLKNEMDLNKLALSPRDKEIYKTYLKYKDMSAKMDGGDGNNANPITPAIHKNLVPNLYVELNNMNGLEFINVAKTATDFELKNILKDLHHHPEDYKEFDEAEAFVGLDASDFTTVRDINEFTVH
ncbi:unnamed protein product [Ambrosiozyma monospora]|uniref:Unnamed protein product n=1 Tax=Ambrosiozyma monospora TaxID=43982 RepID=A0ACB5STZ2_AMBMO|nr:unnamed protein product [Ambrosiozyma monospora]